MDALHLFREVPDISSLSSYSPFQLFSEHGRDLISSQRARGTRRWRFPLLQRDTALLVPLLADRFRPVPSFTSLSPVVLAGGRCSARVVGWPMFPRVCTSRASRHHHRSLCRLWFGIYVR